MRLRDEKPLNANGYKMRYIFNLKNLPEKLILIGFWSLAWIVFWSTYIEYLPQHTHNPLMGMFAPIMVVFVPFGGIPTLDDLYLYIIPAIIYWGIVALVFCMLRNKINYGKK